MKRGDFFLWTTCGPRGQQALVGDQPLSGRMPIQKHGVYPSRSRDLEFQISNFTTHSAHKDKVQPITNGIASEPPQGRGAQ